MKKGGEFGTLFPIIRSTAARAVVAQDRRRRIPLLTRTFVQAPLVDSTGHWSVDEVSYGIMTNPGWVDVPIRVPPWK